MTRDRRAGSRWRILVHRMAPGRGSDFSHHIQSWEEQRVVDSEFSDTRAMVGTEFDELVVGRWVHIEAMDTGLWWADLGGVTVHVKADRDGRPKIVTVHMPGCYADAVDGCEYRLNDEEWPTSPPHQPPDPTGKQARTP